MNSTPPNPLTVTLAGILLLFLLAALFVFHIFVIVGVVPASTVWGGQAGDSSMSLISLELMALIVTAIFGIIIAAKMGYIKTGRFQRASRTGTWLVFGYLLLNSILNFASGNPFEVHVFGPVSIVMSLCALRLAVH